MNDAIIALIRTVVPTIVGAFVAWLASLGLNLEEESSAALIIALTGLFTGAYYTAVRWLGERYPWVNWLLGYNSTPTYSRDIES